MTRILKTLYIIATVVIVFLPFALSAQQTEIKKIHNDSTLYEKSGSLSEEKTANLRPVLSIKPREIDFGILRPGEGAKGSFVLKNVGSGSLQWSTTGPAGWSALEKQKLSCELNQNRGELNIHLSYLDNNMPGNKIIKPVYNVQLIMESDNRRVIYRKDVSNGTYREIVPIISNGGERTIFYRFRVVNGRSGPTIKVDPLRIDFGGLSVGEKVTKRVQLTNRGTDPLKWRIEGFKNTNTGSLIAVKRGRYISFQNDEIKGKSIYEIPAILKDQLDIIGPWAENSGYPEAHAGGSLRYRFSGSGITVFFRKGPGCGKLLAYVDDRLMNEIDCLSDQHERSESIIAEGLMDMPHVLTLVNSSGQTMIEGISIYGREVRNTVAGTINIFPNSGVTTKETDYVNVSINTERLVPGWYGDAMVIQTPGGDVVVEMSFEVLSIDVPKILDVFRYVKNNAYLYTTNPQAEARQIEIAGYQKEGIAFRLFKTGTPGTVSFYRWYNPQKGDHFYSYDANGGGKSLNGYVYEGIIGNIATSRLTNTKGLYRWYNPSKGTHFYTTDQNGEGLSKRGYRFEAIAGYVR